MEKKGKYIHISDRYPIFSQDLFCMFLEKLYTYYIYLERSAKVAERKIPVESCWTGFKIGWQGFPRTRKAPTVKLYISEHFSAKCVTRRGCSFHPQFKFIPRSLVTTQCIDFHDLALSISYAPSIL